MNKKIIRTALLTAICIVAVVLPQLIGKETITLFGPYKVERIIDGDTFSVYINEEKKDVRLIGIDTPESVHPDTSKNSVEGEIASEYSETRLLNKEIYLEYDVAKQDKYGRILAYLYIDNEMYNKELLNAGYARVMTIPPNVKYADIFLDIQSHAQKNKVGFWKKNPLNQ